MTSMFRFKLFFWYFCHFKVMMIGYLKPRLVTLNEVEIVIFLPLRRRSRNHLKSMYFGALAVGADLAGGIHGFYHAKLAQCEVALIFKSFQAQFLRRPESGVYFICTEGLIVQQMIEEGKKTGERITRPINISAYTDYPNSSHKVAHFILELSLKVRL